MPLATVAVQKSVYERLLADAELATMIGGGKVYDYVPDATPAPFVVLGDDGDLEVRNLEFTDLIGEAHELTVTLHTWTEAPRGRLTAKRILSRLHDLLLDEPLPIEGFTLITMDFLSAQVMREEDGLTYHGIIRTRCVTHPVD